METEPNIIMNTDHKHYDFSLEVLATLSQEPVVVRLKTMQQDFGLSTATPIKDALSKLRAEGYEVRSKYRTSPSGDTGGYVAWIAAKGWSEAQIAAGTYWGKVYG